MSRCFCRQQMLGRFEKGRIAETFGEVLATLVSPLLLPTRAREWGAIKLRRALSPTFPAGEMVFFIPWRVVAEESGAAHFGLGGAMPARPARADGEAAGGAVDFHFSDKPVQGDDGARAVGASDDDASPVRRELRGQLRHDPIGNSSLGGDTRTGLLCFRLFGMCPLTTGARSRVLPGINPRSRAQPTAGVTSPARPMSWDATVLLSYGILRPQSSRLTAGSRTSVPREPTMVQAARRMGTSQ
jgi:hypothetical protein